MNYIKVKYKVIMTLQYILKGLMAATFLKIYLTTLRRQKIENIYINFISQILHIIEELFGVRVIAL